MSPTTKWGLQERTCAESQGVGIEAPVEEGSSGYVGHW